MTIKNRATFLGHPVYRPTDLKRGQQDMGASRTCGYREASGGGRSIGKQDLQVGVTGLCYMPITSCLVPLHDMSCRTIYIQAWSDRLRGFGLHLNTVKTEYLDRPTSSHQGSIKVNGDALKKTEAFPYLGSKLLVDGGIDGEARARVGATAMERSHWRSL